MTAAMATPAGWADLPSELSAATDDILSGEISELSFIKSLGWYDLWIVAVVSLIPCIPMLILFEWQRHRRTHFWPKASFTVPSVCTYYIYHVYIYHHYFCRRKNPN